MTTPIAVDDDEGGEQGQRADNAGTGDCDDEVAAHYCDQSGDVACVASQLPRGR